MLQKRPRIGETWTYRFAAEKVKILYFYKVRGVLMMKIRWYGIDETFDTIYSVEYFLDDFIP